MKLIVSSYVYCIVDSINTCRIRTISPVIHLQVHQAPRNVPPRRQSISSTLSAVHRLTLGFALNRLKTRSGSRYRYCDILFVKFSTPVSCYVRSNSSNDVHVQVLAVRWLFLQWRSAERFYGSSGFNRRPNVACCESPASVPLCNIPNANTQPANVATVH
jgi:hypothetical protein